MNSFAENGDKAKYKFVENRLYFIDYSKSIGIYLVVLGHSVLTEQAHNFLYSFHMPLFFAISGILFRQNSETSFVSFFNKRFKQLMIPYFFLNIVTYLFWVFIGRKFGSDVVLNIPFYKPLLGIFYGNGIDNFLQHCTSLWFIPCLFVVENLYFIFLKKNKVLVLVAFFIIGLADHYLALPRLPWGLNIAMTAIIFYGLGNSFKNIISHHPFSIWTKILIFSISLSCLLILSKINGNVDMDNRMYNNYSLFILSGISGTIMILVFAKILEQFIKPASFIEFISNGTIVILAFHAIAGSVIRGVTLYVFHQPISIYDYNILNCSIYSLLSIIMLFPLIYLLNNYFPVLIGKKRFDVKPTQG